MKFTLQQTALPNSRQSPRIHICWVHNSEDTYETYPKTMKGGSTLCRCISNGCSWPSIRLSAASHLPSAFKCYIWCVIFLMLSHQSGVVAWQMAEQ